MRTLIFRWLGPKALRLFIALTLVSGAFAPSCAHTGKTAYALPLTAIAVDGDFGDWPADLPAYDIAQIHPKDYHATPPAGPADFQARFRAGYSADDNVLYLAVEVRDDDLVNDPASPHWDNQDVCEIYIDGDHSADDDATRGGAGAQQYAMVAGPGPFFSGVDANPALVFGDTETSGVRASYRRTGDLTAYEWAIPLYSRFPHRRLQVRPGHPIGFDIAISDADGGDPGNWIAWTPGDDKFRRSDRLADLDFIADPADLGLIAGTVARTDGAPWAGVPVYITAAGERADPRNPDDATDDRGAYAAWRTQGKYTVAAARPGHAVQSITLQPGQRHTAIDLAPRLGLLSGRVTGAGAAPRFNAEVAAQGPEDSATTTDVYGRYGLWLEPGRYEVSVTGAEDAEHVAVEINAGDAQEGIDFTVGSSGQALSTWPIRLGLGATCLGIFACLIPLARRRELLGGILLSPRDTLRRLDAAPDQAGPAYMLLAVSLLGSIVAVAAMLDALSGGAGPSLGLASGAATLTVALGIAIFAYAHLLFRTGVLALCARLLGVRVDARVLFSAVGYAALPEYLLGGLVAVAAVSLAGVDPLSASHLTSLAALQPGSGGGEYATILWQEIDFFDLWSLVLTALAVQRVGAIGGNKAGLMVALYWATGMALLLGWQGATAQFQRIF